MSVLEWLFEAYKIVFVIFVVGALFITLVWALMGRTLGGARFGRQPSRRSDDADL